MADSVQKTRKNAPASRAPVIDETALDDKLAGVFGELRNTLRAGDTVALPGLVQQMLSQEPSKGDRAKVMAWRSFVVWAEWTGTDWDVVVMQDGKPRA